MKLKFFKNDLISGINIVLRAVPSKTTMPILECILIDASENSIKLVANDLEFGIETECEGEIIEKGQTALDARLFSDIVRRLPQEDNMEVFLETISSANIAIIKCYNTVFKIQERNPDEFTALPLIDTENSIEISQFTFKNMINQTIFSISNNDSNKKMTGEYLEVEDEFLQITSLDGHRISIRREILNDSYDKMSALIPGKTLLEISRILSGGIDDKIKLFFSKSHMLISFDKTLIVTRLIDGEYFHVSQMISEDYELMVIANRKKLLENIERSTIFIRENDRQPLIFKIEGDVLQLIINTDLGRMDAEMEIRKTGNDLMIGFNPRYLIEALRSIEEEEVRIYLSIPRSPMFIRDDKGSYNYMILPINFRADSI